ncbi:hypothetical protein NQ117_15360 [Paenibacillus sp. SC116]|nr:hypothetical protein [Paenibacillus sp. SC116]MCR8845060.1 hypothetical protein [Paenibacillus sp. SC116]
MKRLYGVCFMLVVFLAACTNQKNPDLHSWAHDVVTWNNGV